MLIRVDTVASTFALGNVPNYLKKMSEGFVTCSAGELFYEQRGGGTGVPLIAIHGGPGFGGLYLTPLFELSGRLPIIIYDQAGAGRARRSGARKVFSVEGFVDELEALRRALDVPEVSLLGHSFGGVIASEYALQYQDRVRKLVLASVSIDIPRWRADATRLINQLPLMARMILKEGERTGQINSPAYLGALSEYYRRFVYGFDEKPEYLIASETTSDALTYQTVWGPNELIVSGTARDINLSPKLHEIQCPTLLTCGRFDEATPEAHEHFASLLPDARTIIFERSAHHPHLSETSEYNDAILQFLTS